MVNIIVYQEGHPSLSSELVDWFKGDISTMFATNLSNQFLPIGFPKLYAMCYHIYVTMHVKNPSSLM